jgi:adenylate cyclase class 2
LLEVEVKARCGDVRERLKELGARYIQTEFQHDVYFTHPCRDFRETDEALRIRRVKDRFYLTYKGPKLDSETKTREELEYEVPEGVREILLKLGFSEYGTVKKKRESYEVEGLEVCLDEVEGLGSFIEIESRDVGDKDRIFKLLEKLGIPQGDCALKTYLELLEGA